MSNPTVSWDPVQAYLRRVPVRLAPIAGSAEWCALPDDDPRKLDAHHCRFEMGARSRPGGPPRQEDTFSAALPAQVVRPHPFRKRGGVSAPSTASDVYIPLDANAHALVSRSGCWPTPVHVIPITAEPRYVANDTINVLAGNSVTIVAEQHSQVKAVELARRVRRVATSVGVVAPPEGVDTLERFIINDPDDHPMQSWVDLLPEVHRSRSRPSPLPPATVRVTQLRHPRRRSRRAARRAPGRNQAVSRHDDPDTIDLLGGILADVPSLPGAACVGSSRLFDPAALGESPADVAERHAIAVDMCRDCPVFVACRDWVNALPRHRRPPGVIGGRKPGVGRPPRADAA